MSSFGDFPKLKSKGKGKSSAFLTFMMQFKKKEERNGNFMSMEEAQIESGKIWETMGPEERSKYDFQAKESTCDRVRYTTNGISFDEIERQKKEAQKQQRTMELTVEEMLQTAVETKNLKSLEFVFFSTSYFAQTIDGEIFPAEIAMAKFSLAEGVFDTFSFIVDPGDLRVGLAASALFHSQSTHKIPIPPHKDKIQSESDFGFLFNKIMNFLVGPDAGRKIPPIFTASGSRNTEIEVVKKTLDKIVTEGSEGRNFSFRVYPIEHLLYRLNKKCVADRNNGEEPFTSVHMAERELHVDENMYLDLGCDLHCRDDNSANCCLSKVKRWGFQFAKKCLDAGTDKLIRGRHLPQKVIVTGQSDVTSSSSKDSMWDSDMSDSFRQMKIKSDVTVSHSPAPSHTVSDTESIHSLDITHKTGNSTSGDSEAVFKPTKPSYSQLLRMGRGGRRSTTPSSMSNASKK